MTSKTIILPDGRTAHLVEIEFDVVSETWNEYQLANNLRLKIKNVVTKTFLLIDDDGNPILDAEGLPAVSVDGQIITTTRQPSSTEG